MKAISFINPPSVYIEIGQSSLKVLQGEASLELPLDRLENGRLTQACREQLRLGLRDFFKQPRWPRKAGEGKTSIGGQSFARAAQVALQNIRGWQAPSRAYCAIGARGVSLRRLTLPAASKDELQQVIRLQIENEFPLPPDELAWGYRQLNLENGLTTGTPGVQELVVVAMKKEPIEEYSQILSHCGLVPIFTLGALARSALCPQTHESYAILDIGRKHSELVSFDHGVASSLRVLPWGGEDLTRAIEKRLAITRAEAETLKMQWNQESDSNGELGQKVQAAIQSELDALAASIRPEWIGKKLYLAGGSARLKELAPRLTAIIGGGVECQRMVLPDEGGSAAILGLKKSCEENGDCPLLVLQAKGSRPGQRIAAPAPRKWAALAILLAVGCLCFPYAEALLMKARLARKLAGMKADLGRLATIDRELNFLQYLRKNQPPYPDALIVLANAAPPGMRIESLSMNRRGEVSLRGSLQTSQQVTDFRSKLIASAFFASVSVDEQTPGPGPEREKVAVRITAQWKPAEARQSLSFDIPAEKSKTARPEATSGALPQTQRQMESPVPMEMPPSSLPRTASPATVIKQ